MSQYNATADCGTAEMPDVDSRIADEDDRARVEPVCWPFFVSELAHSRNVGRVTSAANASARPFLIFTEGAERYGIALDSIAATFGSTPCTFVPGGPPELFGVASVNGVVRSVLDLRPILGLAIGSDGQSTAPNVILVRVRGMELGILAQTLEGIGHFASEQIAPFRADTAASATKITRGVTPDGVIVLNMEAVEAYCRATCSS